jgi:hypothetical protein
MTCCTLFITFSRGSELDNPWPWEKSVTPTFGTDGRHDPRCWGSTFVLYLSKYPYLVELPLSPL